MAQKAKVFWAGWILGDGLAGGVTWWRGERVLAVRWCDGRCRRAKSGFRRVRVTVIAGKTSLRTGVSTTFRTLVGYGGTPAVSAGINCATKRSIASQMRINNWRRGQVELK